jgi:hypothetical protein
MSPNEDRRVTAYAQGKRDRSHAARRVEGVA